MKGFWVGCAFAAGLLAFGSPGSAQTQTPPPAAPSLTSPAPTTPSKPALSKPAAPPAASSTPATPSKPAAPAPAPAASSAPGAPPPGPPPGLKLAPGPNEPDQGVPGLPSDATTVTLDVPARPVAELTDKATWDDAFKVIKDAQERVKAAVGKAGLKVIGHPVTLFTQEDDKGFTFTAMLPLDPSAKPGAQGALGDGVTLGQSPAGKAIKFQHRGAYDDIDSTYDLVTAYLDEKNLEAQDFFAEEYLTPLTSVDDPYLAVDIYVFLKP